VTGPKAAIALAALCAAIVATAVYASLRRSEPALEPLPVLGDVPTFELTDQTETSFGSERLRGKVWIANFIFTRCPTVCPVFTQKMARVQQRTRDFGPSLMLVSFSVDPDWDTPARLAEYAGTFSADAGRWKFLTGTPEDVRITVREGLKIAMEDQGMIGDVPDIIHGTHFVLIDERGQIRGYFDSSEADRIDEMIQHARQLIEQAH